MPTQVEEKRLATWGTDIPDDLVLDEKLLVEALKKVNECPTFVFVYFPHVLNILLSYYFLKIL